LSRDGARFSCAIVLPVFERFAPYTTLAQQLLPIAVPTTDGSHDVAHLQRVWASATRIHASEGGNGEVLAAAVLLHDCVAVEKNSPQRREASRLAAVKATGILTDLGWNATAIAAVSHAIEAHSFTAQIVPETLEARILQDADRLDALGAMGVARLFYVAGRMGSRLYDPDDPAASRRALDDGRFAFDHFGAKLFKLTGGFQTATGAHLAEERATRMRAFYDAFLNEI
jgi:uncharacterized protein